MSSFWERLRQAASTTEDGIDYVRDNISERISSHSDVTIVPYMGYGTAKMIRLRGRILQNVNVKAASDDDSMWRNLVNFYRRLNTSELPYAEITATFGDKTRTFTADKEGYFIVQFELDAAPTTGWHDVQLRYDDGNRQADATGRVIVTLDNAQFGVISDFDDTVIRTDVTNLLKMARNVFFKNSLTRLSFKGVAEFYKALQFGTSSTRRNPIFYVSNSPYNLYDLITDFMDYREIPLGPIFLRDIGLTEKYLLASKQHKSETIDRLMTTYPDLPFILVGDSGEHDPDIYLQVAQTYPNRVKAIYIRDVRPHKQSSRRKRHVAEVAEKVRAAGSELLLIPDTQAAAEHAAAQGFIQADSVQSIKQAAIADAFPKDDDQTDK